MKPPDALLKTARKLRTVRPGAHALVQEALALLRALRPFAGALPLALLQIPRGPQWSEIVLNVSDDDTVVHLLSAFPIVALY